MAKTAKKNKTDKSLAGLVIAQGPAMNLRPAGAHRNKKHDLTRAEKKRLALEEENLRDDD